MSRPAPCPPGAPAPGVRYFTLFACVHLVDGSTTLSWSTYHEDGSTEDLDFDDYWSADVGPSVVQELGEDLAQYWSQKLKSALQCDLDPLPAPWLPGSHLNQLRLPL